MAKGDRVMLLSLNRIEGIEVYLGAARSGMVAAALNWRLAAHELEQIVRDCDGQVLIYEDQYSDLAQDLARRCNFRTVLCFGEGSDGSYERFLGSGAGSECTRNVSPGDPVMILYTGGTTGKSKGVVHSHAGVIAAMVNNTIAERIVEDDRYLLLSQLFHSATILAMNYLLNGATLVLLPRFEPRAALEAIESERVTKSLAFPAMVNYLLAAADDSQFNLGSLRNMQYGGGPISERVIRQMADVLRCDLLQCYGTTEQVGVTFLTPEDHREAFAGRNAHRLSSAGRTAHLAHVILLDASGQPVPQDGKTPGEIHVSSLTNMLGYWGQPELTAALRGPNGELGTGDIAVWDRDGYIYVVDRAKEMVISGGENIYPSQVENAISEHESVLECAVVGQPDEVWGESVVAFVVPRKGMDVGPDDVQAIVTERLGSYQKPRIVHFLEELPKTASGKIAKADLRHLALAMAKNADRDPDSKV